MNQTLYYYDFYENLEHQLPFQHFMNHKKKHQYMFVFDENYILKNLYIPDAIKMILLKKL